MPLGDYHNVRDGAKNFLFYSELQNTALEDGSEDNA